VNATTDLPEALQGKRRLGPGEAFRFGCHPGVPCFNRCCADVNILLTPLDVLTLARRLGVSTGEFLDRHTLTPITKDLHLPVVMLRMTDAEGKPCPFVGESGCTVYEDRPWACRMYPLGMALTPARAGQDPEAVYFLFEDDFCHGREAGRDWTTESWRDDQGVPAREALEAGFRDVVGHPWFIGGRQLDPKRIEMFHQASYDLDAFRCFVFDSTFLSRFEVAGDEVEAIRTDDFALMAFAFRWLRFALFAEPTMKVRADAITSGRKP
jgi:Fe-S-cluster containining protein